MSTPITIAIAQIDIAFTDRERNLARMIQVLEGTAAKDAKLTVFPEAALTGYCFDSLEQAQPHAEPIPGPSTEVLGKLAPAFWGRQVEQRVPELIAASDFRIISEQVVRQAFYPSRVLVARK